jgi:hypothetical protein
MTSPHIGTVTLTGLRIVILPKLRIDHLMRMVAYAFALSDLIVTETQTTYGTSDQGLIDLLGLALLRAVERIARGGLLPEYQSRHEDLPTPRGRMDLRHIATHARLATLRCTYDDLTTDHRLNQVLAAGLRLAAAVMQSSDLRLDLARAADRFFGDLTRLPLAADSLRSLVDDLDRRSSHYRTALTLVTLIHQGARLGEHAPDGEMPLSSFLLNWSVRQHSCLPRPRSHNRCASGSSAFPSTVSSTGLCATGGHGDILPASCRSDAAT